MAKTIIGLDIGHWSIKITTLDLRDHSLLSFQEHLHPTSEEVLHVKMTTPDSLIEEIEGDVAGLSTEDDGAAAAEEAPAPTTDDVALWLPTLKKRVEEGDFLEAETICCNVPAQLVTFLQIPVPFEDEDKVATILPSLLDSKLTTDLHQFFWSFYVEKQRQEGGNDEFFARVAVIERAQLTKFIEDLKSAGIEPNSLVFAPLALSEALHFKGKLGRQAVKSSEKSEKGGLEPLKMAARSEKKQPCFGFLDLGHTLTTLTVIDPNTDEPCIITARMTMFGVNDLASSISKTLEIPHNDALRRLLSFPGFLDFENDIDLVVAQEGALHEAKEFQIALQKGMRSLVRDLRRVLQGLYAQSKVEVLELYMMGGGAKIAGLSQELSHQLGIRVTDFVGAKYSLATVNPTITAAMQNPNSWALANNAAEISIRRRTCNFRHGPFAFRGRSSYLQKQIIKFVVAFLILVGLAFAILYAQKASLVAQRDAMRAELSTHTKQLFGSPILAKKKIKTLLSGNGEGGEKRLIPTRSAFEIGFDIVSHMPSDLDLNVSRFEVDTRRSIVQIRGSTTDAQAVDRLVSSLEEIRCIKDIKKERLTLRGSRADFELQINTEGCS